MNFSQQQGMLHAHTRQAFHQTRDMHTFMATYLNDSIFVLKIFEEESWGM